MNRKAAHTESTINEIRFHLRGDALTKFENISYSDNPPMNYEQLKVALEQAFPNQGDALFHRQSLKDRKQKRTETADVRKALKFKRFTNLNHLIEEAAFMGQEILRDEANVVFSPSARYNVGLQKPVLALEPSGNYDDSSTRTPNLGVGCPRSQSPGSSPPRTPQSFCSEDDKTEKVGEKENWAPQMEMAQDINGPGNKEVLLANFHIPKISRLFRALLLEPGSLEPNFVGFQKEVRPKSVFERLEGQVASWDGNSLISTHGDLGGCKANAGHCVMADGII
uniref:Uncharacterized protein n=1 Tax=Romanomermis culicivorax TaxID=13658 RepID=A0A915JN12_ROMCU